MMQIKKQLTRGASLMEVMVIGSIGLAVMAGAVQMFISMNSANKFSMSMPQVQSDATEIVKMIAASLREAPLCDPTAGCVGTANAAVLTASSTGITIYKTAAGATIQYSLSGGALRKTENSVTTTLYPATVTLNMSYLYSPGALYSMTADPSTLSWANQAVNASDRINLIAAKISATVTRNGVTSTYSTIIRLRNSPKKTSTNY
jgi:Tfp pilus assembly protein PilW